MGRLKEGKDVKKTWLLLLSMVVAAFLAVPAVKAADEGKEKKDKEEIALDQVPANVKAAAEQAVKDIVITEAEKETKKGKVIYELTGKVGDKEYDVKVDADGKVLKVKEAEEEKGKDSEEKTKEKYGKKKSKGKEEKEK